MIYQSFPRIIGETYEYWIDAFQRSILFMDSMRRRGNSYIENRRKAHASPPIFECIDVMTEVQRELCDMANRPDSAGEAPQGSHAADGAEVGDETAFDGFFEMQALLYQMFEDYYLKFWMGDAAQEIFREFHPLKFARFAFSNLNPALLPVRYWATIVKYFRKPAAVDNTLRTQEAMFAKILEGQMDFFKMCTGMSNDLMLQSMSGNPLFQTLMESYRSNGGNGGNGDNGGNGGNGRRK